MKKQVEKQSSWGWYGVKVLYENIVTGEPCNKNSN